MAGEGFSLVHQGVDGTGAATVLGGANTFTKVTGDILGTIKEEVKVHKQKAEEALKNDQAIYEVELAGLQEDIQRELINARNEFQDYVKSQWAKGINVTDTKNVDVYFETNRRKQKLNDMIQAAKAKETEYNQTMQRYAANPGQYDPVTAKNIYELRQTPLSKWSDADKTGVFVLNVDPLKLAGDINKIMNQSSKEMAFDEAKTKFGSGWVPTTETQDVSSAPDIVASIWNMPEYRKALEQKGYTQESFTSLVKSTQISKSGIQEVTIPQPKTTTESKGGWSYGGGGASNGKWTFKASKNKDEDVIVMSRDNVPDNAYIDFPNPQGGENPKDAKTVISMSPTALVQKKGVWYLTGKVKNTDKRTGKTVEQTEHVKYTEAIASKLFTETSSGGQPGFELEAFLKQNQSGASTNSAGGVPIGTADELPD